MEQRQTYGTGQRVGSLRTLRWALVAGSLAIAAVLLLRRDYILGLLIGVLALVRVTYLLALGRRFPAQSASRPTSRPGSGRGSGPGSRRAPGREVLRALARPEYGVAAGVIGMSPPETRRAFDDGRTLVELAAGAGVPLDRVINAIVSDASVKIDQARAQGRVSEERASHARAQLPVWAHGLVNFRKGDLQRARGRG